MLRTSTLAMAAAVALLLSGPAAATIPPAIQDDGAAILDDIAQRCHDYGHALYNLHASGYEVAQQAPRLVAAVENDADHSRVSAGLRGRMLQILRQAQLAFIGSRDTSQGLAGQQRRIEHLLSSGRIATSTQTGRANRLLYDMEHMRIECDELCETMLHWIEALQRVLLRPASEEH